MHRGGGKAGKRGIRSKRRNCHEWNAAYHLLISITSYNGCRQPHNATRRSAGTSSREITRRCCVVVSSSGVVLRNREEQSRLRYLSLLFLLSSPLLFFLPSSFPSRRYRSHTTTRRERSVVCTGTRTKGGGDVTECFIYRAGKPRLCTTPPVHDTPACLRTLVYKHGVHTRGSTNRVRVFATKLYGRRWIV